MPLDHKLLGSQLHILPCVAIVGGEVHFTFAFLSTFVCVFTADE